MKERKKGKCQNDSYIYRCLAIGFEDLHLDITDNNNKNNNELQTG